MTGLFGIILSLFLLMYLAYKGFSVIVIAPLLALLAVFISQDAPLLATYSQIFMPAMGSFLIKYFPIFLMGAIFGKLMDKSGAASSIAQNILKVLGPNHVFMAIVLSCGLLTYGGISAFVVVFTVYPLSNAMCKAANLPRRLIPAAIALGAFTFSMTALPGSAQIHNLIPMPYFGTNAFAAPYLGLICGFFMFALGQLWLNLRLKKALSKKESYSIAKEFKTNEQSLKKVPGFFISILPLFCVILLNYLFTEWIPQWDASYLAQDKFASVDVKKVAGIWSMNSALFLSIIVLISLHFKRLIALKDDISQGALSSLLPIFNTGSEVGYGAVIASLSSFDTIKEAVVGSSSNPIFSSILSINTLAGITGSASGGMSIALQALGNNLIQLSQQTGLSLEYLHRFCALSSGGFDTLPHNGAVITLLTVCGLSHKESYKDIAVVSLAIPFCVVLSAFGIGSLLGIF